MFYFSEQSSDFGTVGHGSTAWLDHSDVLWQCMRDLLLSVTLRETLWDVWPEGNAVLALS